MLYAIKTKRKSMAIPLHLVCDVEIRMHTVFYNASNILQNLICQTFYGNISLAHDVVSQCIVK